MSRLPTALEPLFPTVKRVHRAATRGVGGLTRRAHAPSGGRDRLPWRGTESSDETVKLEPESVRMVVVAPSHLVHRPAPTGSPANHPFFTGLIKYQVPRRHALEITNGLVVGNYAAHITPGGTLDYETSEYFGIKGWREHPIYLRPRLPVVRRASGSLLSLATRGTADNYYHFVMDLLPRWGIFREAMPDVEPDLVLLNKATAYQRELLAMVGIADLPSVEATKDTALRADELLVPGQPNLGTLAPPWTTDWLRKTLPPRDPDGRAERIYITRGSRPHTRRVVNETELLPALRRFGFTILDPGSLPVQEQIDHFAAARVVVGPHGAALTNLTFCRPGVRVLELFAPRYLNSCYWTITSNVDQSHYRYLVGESRRPRKPGAPMLGVQDDITVDVSAFERELAVLLEG